MTDDPQITIDAPDLDEGELAAAQEAAIAAVARERERREAGTCPGCGCGVLPVTFVGASTMPELEPRRVLLEPTPVLHTYEWRRAYRISEGKIEYLANAGREDGAVHLLHVCAPPDEP